MAWVVKVNGGFERPKDTSLDALQYAVGGYVEKITLLNGMDGFVNEDGKSLGLQPNAKASTLYGRDIIVGNMVMAEPGEVK